MFLSAGNNKNNFQKELADCGAQTNQLVLQKYNVDKSCKSQTENNDKNYCKKNTVVRVYHVYDPSGD